MIIKHNVFFENEKQKLKLVCISTQDILETVYKKNLNFDRYAWCLSILPDSKNLNLNKFVTIKNEIELTRDW